MGCWNDLWLQFVLGFVNVHVSWSLKDFLVRLISVNVDNNQLTNNNNQLTSCDGLYLGWLYVLTGAEIETRKLKG